MTEDEARRVELVRAIENEDHEAALLTAEDRAQAEAHARSASGGAKRRADRFIAARAEFAAARLSTHHPGIAGLLRRSEWPGWLGVVLPLLAFGLGVLANEFGTDRRLDLLAVPLLGMIAWNIAVYIYQAVALLGGGARGLGNPLHRLIARIAGIGSRDFDRGSALHRAAHAFEARWAAAAAPLADARISRTLHLSAALFAAGLILGIYGRALVIEYLAGWESTFLGPEAVRALFGAVLGPASAVTGIAIPPVAEIAAMRWDGAEQGGVNAAPWIYLYTATIVGIVIVPRLALAAWQGARAIALARRFPMTGREDFYIRRLGRSAAGTAGIARVTPYAYRPGEETRRRLTAALRAALGDGAEVRFDEPVDYGSEENWLADHRGDPEDDYHVLLFTLSATPEDENHGALATGIATGIAERRPGTVLAAIIDESPYRAHFAGQAGLDERIARRLDAWRKVLAAAGVVPLGLDLSQELDNDLSQRVESGLLPDGAMA